jgi:hypothetical protein
MDEDGANSKGREQRESNNLCSPSRSLPGRMKKDPAGAKSHRGIDFEYYNVSVTMCKL